MLRIGEVPGKGRGVFAARDIKAGEVVLREQPLLLYPQQSTAAAFCSYCLRAFNSLGSAAEAVVPCGNCGRVGFCSATCAAAAAADPGSHCAAVCALLSACHMAGLSDEQQTALQFLARCCNLRLAAATGQTAAAARMAALAALAAPPPLSQQLAQQQQQQGSAVQAESSTSSTMVVQELLGRLRHAVAAVGAPPEAAPTLEETLELLRKEGANGYGIMAPSAPDGERRIRGTAIYSQASLINHECLPSLARFDCFDGTPVAGAGATAATAGAHTAVEFRALHDVPAGEELTQSYFPLPWPLADRRQRCQEDYGFTCTCPRCQEEATWSEAGSEDWETDEDAGMEDAAAAEQGHSSDCQALDHHHHEHPHQPPPLQQEDGGGAAEGPVAEGMDAAYINLFLLKFVCPAEGCYGTMAPPAPPGPADHYECNMCGRWRTEAEFMAELEATH